MKAGALGKIGTDGGAGVTAGGMGLKARLCAHREALEARLAYDRAGARDDGLALGRDHARFLEAILVECFGRASLATLPGGASAKGLALAAVGSLGRGAVALRGDADVVIITDPGAGAVPGGGEPVAFAEALLYPLWDATLPVGHQILNVHEAIGLAQKDLTTATALLDLRYLAGDRALFDDLVERASRGLFAEQELGAFNERLQAEVLARHARFGGSVFLLEPDVKSGAGGLRDLDCLRWAARARYRVGEATATGGEASDGRAGGSVTNVAGVASTMSVWPELVRLGVMVAREAQAIGGAEEYLWRVRNRLHARAGRKSDRLGFEEQEAIGVAMQYGGDRARAAERLMQDFYLHARVITRARESLFEKLRPSRRRGKVIVTDLDGGVRVFDGQVTIASTAQLSSDPALALRLYAACARLGAPVLPFARDAVSRAAADPAWGERLRASPEAASLFTELVCWVAETPARASSMLSELHEVGLLLAMVPEFLPVTGRVHHDVYHVYTVDVHSVAAVDRLRQLARGELAAEYPLSSRLAAEVTRPLPLFLATLLHDVGKGWPDATGSRKNHSKTGAELCRQILPRLGLSDDDVDEACQLVADHLLMYHVATRRDLDDPATIEEFCRGVRGPEGLRHLYLLTVADLSTTSPTSMTSWKARMLDELYFAAVARLDGQSSGPVAERLSRVRQAVRQAWPDAGMELEAFLQSMPERYLLASTPEAIAAHARIAHARGSRLCSAARVPWEHPEAAELCVVAADCPGLLARIAAAITANRLEVMAAQVYSRPTAAATEAVDLFWVRDREGGTEGVDPALPRLERDLDDLCGGKVDPGDLLRSRLGGGSPWRERPSPAVPTKVQVDDRASPTHTVVEVFARDRPGLLYTLAEALHTLGLSIALSKINTEGTRVADVFYVSELDGSKVTIGPRCQQIHDALVRAVG